MTENILYTTGQAAAQLGVSPSTLRRWTDQGRVAFLRTPGGQRRFTSQQIREFQQPLLNASEAAREVGLSARSLRRWARQGVIPSTKTVQGRLRFTWHDIREIENQMENAQMPELLRDVA